MLGWYSVANRNALFWFVYCSKYNQTEKYSTIQNIQVQYIVLTKMTKKEQSVKTINKWNESHVKVLRWFLCLVVAMVRINQLHLSRNNFSHYSLMKMIKVSTTVVSSKKSTIRLHFISFQSMVVKNVFLIYFFIYFSSKKRRDNRDEILTVVPIGIHKKDRRTRSVYKICHGHNEENLSQDFIWLSRIIRIDLSKVRSGEGGHCHCIRNIVMTGYLWPLSMMI
jgi:hypothetical protein